MPARYCHRFRALVPALAIACTAGCGGGGRSAAPSGSLTVSDCVIAGDAATCQASVAWSTTGASSPRLLVDGVQASMAASGTLSVDIGIEPTTVTLQDGARTLDESSVHGSCEAASAWNGLRCLVFAVRRIERAPTPFLEDGAAVTLEVVLYAPVAGVPPHPAVMFNHGSTGDGSDPALFRQTFVHEGIARFFAEHGWLVAFPQRRGRGQSDGNYDEGFEPDRSRYSCEAEHSLPGLERALGDLNAATDFLHGLADVNPARMVEAGFSRGGILAVAHVADRPETFRGAINFVGGWIAEACVDAVPVNRESFLRGTGFDGASIWLYAEDDSFYSVGHSRSNFEAFTAAGGQGEFHVYQRAPGLDGHFLMNDRELWAADLESYLAQH